MCKLSNEAKLELFDKLIDLTGEYDTREVLNHSMNFRTAKTKDKLLNDTVAEFKKVGIRLSKNELINMCIDLVLGIKQSDEFKNKFYFSRNEMTIMNYLEDQDEAIKSIIKTRLFIEQMELLSNPSKSKREKKTKIQKARRIKEKAEEVE